MGKKYNLKSHITWEDVRKQLFTPEEIAASNFRVTFVGEIRKARNELCLTYKELEEKSGIKQEVLIRIENGTVLPDLDTALAVLAALGKTIYIGDIKY